MPHLLTYRELIRIPTFLERYEYLKQSAIIGESTFGFDRYLNQQFYTSTEWRRFRNKIIVRDCGNDMAHEDYPINGLIIIHHINPLTVEDFEYASQALFDPENVVAVSKSTHDAIHYGTSDLLPKDLIERRPGDTVPWR